MDLSISSNNCEAEIRNITRIPGRLKQKEEPFETGWASRIEIRVVGINADCSNCAACFVIGCMDFCANFLGGN